MAPRSVVQWLQQYERYVDNSCAGAYVFYYCDDLFPGAAPCVDLRDGHIDDGRNDDYDDDANGAHQRHQQQQL